MERDLLADQGIDRNIIRVLQWNFRKLVLGALTGSFCLRVWTVGMSNICSVSKKYEELLD